MILMKCDIQNVNILCLAYIRVQIKLDLSLAELQPQLVFLYPSEPELGKIKNNIPVHRCS